MKRSSIGNRSLSGALASALLLSACQPSLERQPKNASFTRSPFFANGSSARPIPAGTVPFRFAGSEKVPPTLADLEWGQRRFAIHCSVCHGLTGDGRGVAAARGFSGIPSLYEPSTLALSEEELFSTIRNGKGRMYGMGDRLPAREIWALVQYLRALQLSQHARLEDLPGVDRVRLGEAKR